MKKNILLTVLLLAILSCMKVTFANDEPTISGIDEPAIGVGEAGEATEEADNEGLTEDIETVTSSTQQIWPRVVWPR